MASIQKVPVQTLQGSRATAGVQGISWSSGGSSVRGYFYPN